jgi:hypothetical protein
MSVSGTSDLVPDPDRVLSFDTTPRDGEASSLLSNLVLDEFDRELERRGHRVVRYADDCNIYVRGERVMASITTFITHRLKLKVNSEKSAVAQTGGTESFWTSASRVDNSHGLRRRRYGN